MATSSYTFVIVGKNDNPVYELSVSSKRDDSSVNQQNQFFIHAALDIVDEEMWKTPSMFLKVVDKFNDRSISAYVTAGHMRFLLLHDGKGEEQVKSFFTEVHELYLKILLNPFHHPNDSIRSAAFDQRVRNIARKYL
ncbi:trafficking protein particle complex subunit 2 [Guillardia theta CCMP2712]|uniref:Trafficking protein particle complex subunit 2 n=1 Tax=Guillardia theta (strain CCMP2712) TaxID=905079 RepID=L1IG46_GUITC|nr:trafficking protein particle complex subunit 2 [Guillardia theta CCMP2712]EKX35062.1 trafficking protein particle complex subunit 2 [Guillardia theta CCMP2712]|eukprot:XP_005822042.1 trafficking protein particle complex subunit 2 [Guillardia theta CCMP2712]